MIRTLLLITAAVMACAGSATSQTQANWVMVTTSAHHVTGINNMSRATVGGFKRAWFVRVFDETQLQGYDYQLYHYQADCSAQRLRRIAAVAYTHAGRSVDSVGQGDWETIFPESVAEGMIREMCEPEFEGNIGATNVNGFFRAARVLLGRS